MEEQPKEPLLLFVTGIPSKTDCDEVFRCFQGLGTFKFASLKTKKNYKMITLASPATNLKKGFCILLALDLQSFYQALDCEWIDFKGQTLKVAPYVRDPSLEVFCQERESRKVSVKGPFEAGREEFLFAWLEKVFGKIRKTCRLDIPSYKKSSSLRPSKNTTFWVEFNLQDSAESAISAGSLSLPGSEHPIIIEGFKRRRLPSSRDFHIYWKSFQTLLPLPSSYLKCNGASNLTFLTNYENSLIKQVGDTGKKPGLLMHTAHFEKPCSRAYFNLRDEEFLLREHGLQGFEGGLRFAIVVKSQGSLFLKRPGFTTK